MKKFLRIYSKLVLLSIFFIAAAVLIIHFVATTYGFYFTGDTITFFVPAYPGHKGDLLAVFAWFYPSFPPLISFVFNFLRFLPFSFITQHHIYLIVSTLLSVLITYLIVKKITSIKKWHLVLVSLFLFTGSQSLLFLAALSEPLFIFFWLAAIYTTERFLSTKKERYLLLFIIFAGLIPITRYIGIFVVASLEIVIILFTYFTKKEKKYSIPLVLTSLILAWVPILITMIRNHLIAQSFFGHFDRQFQPMFTVLSGMLGDFSHTLISGRDLILILLIGPIIGTQIKWNKSIKNFIILSSLSITIYYLNLIVILTNYRNEQAIPFRYFAAAYPILMLLTLSLGSLFIRRFPKFQKFVILSLIIAVLVFASELTTSINRFISEVKSNQSVITGGNNIHAGAEHSADIRRFCRGKTKNKFLLLQESSRNWIAQSLNFYCQPIEMVSMKESSFKFPKGSLIYSPYKITNLHIEAVETYKGVKEVILYRTKNQTVLDINEITKKLQFLD